LAGVVQWLAHLNHYPSGIESH